MSKKRILIIITSVVVSWVVIGMFHNDGPLSKSTQVNKTQAVSAMSTLTVSTGGHTGKAVAARTPFDVNSEPSLEGTAVPNGLITDEDGNLVVTPDLKALFDYFFTLQGIKTSEEIRQIIENEIYSKLQEPAKSQALSILNNYLQLQGALDALPGVDADAVNNTKHLQNYLAQRRELRRQFLGDDLMVEFYGLEETYDEYTLQRLAIQNNELLSAQAKLEASQALLNDLPESLRAPIERRQKVLAVREQTKRAEQEGLTPEELFVEREALLGYEVATKFKKLDEQRAQWNNRYETYRAEANQIRGSGLSAEDKTQSLNDLKQQFFSGNEIKRVNSLDRINGY